MMKAIGIVAIVLAGFAWGASVETKSTERVPELPGVTVNAVTSDLGKLAPTNAVGSVVFEIRNDSMQSVRLMNLLSSCGCTSPTSDRATVAPGEKATVTGRVNWTGRRGRQSGWMTVQLVGQGSTTTVRMPFKGQVG
jgi:Protein of unknown function (DUF1573)